MAYNGPPNKKMSPVSSPAAPPKANYTTVVKECSSKKEECKNNFPWWILLFLG